MNTIYDIINVVHLWAPTITKTYMLQPRKVHLRNVKIWQVHHRILVLIRKTIANKLPCGQIVPLVVKACKEPPKPQQGIASWLVGSPEIWLLSN